MIDIIECSRRAFKRKDQELPALSLYGWAMQHLDHEPGEWDETRIHLSDYRHSLEAEDGACERQLYHRLQQDEADDPSLWERLMWDQGFAMQVRFSWLICQGLPEGWDLLEIEMDVSEGLPGDDVGSCDLVLEGPDAILGVEMKTQRGRSFQYLDEPKSNHVIQSQGELYALRNMYPQQQVAHRLLYIDREGQNSPMVFPTNWRDEVADIIEQASGYVNGIMAVVARDSSRESLKTLDPIIEVRENKGPNSIYLKEPWMCSYCKYKGESCPGALPPELTGHGIVAKGDHNGDYVMKTDNGMTDEIEGAIRRAADAGNVKFK